LNVNHAQGGQALPSQTGQIRPPLPCPLCVRHKTRIAALGVIGSTSQSHLLSHLKGLRANARPQPHPSLQRQGGVAQARVVTPHGQQPRRPSAFQHPHPALLHARQSTPTRVGRGHTTPSTIGQQHRQTIGHHDGAHHPGLVGQTGVGHHRAGWVFAQAQHMRAVHLLQKHRRFPAPQAQGLAQTGTVLRHRHRVVTHVVAQIETVVRRPREAPASQSEKGMHALGHLFREQGLIRMGHQLKVWHGLEHKPRTVGHLR